jgi:amino acid transporter
MSISGMPRRRRYRKDRSLTPVLSMFLIGLFTVIGLSPGALVFDLAVDTISPYVQYAFLIVLIVFIYFVYDSIVTPLKHLFRAYRTIGILGLVSLILAFLGGLFLFVEVTGIVYLVVSMAIWKVATRFS